MQSFTLHDVQALVGISRPMVNAMVQRRASCSRAAGRGTSTAFLFRTRCYSVPPIRCAPPMYRRDVSSRSLKKLGALDTGRPLTGIRMTALAGTAAVKDAHGQWHAETGQRLIDLRRLALRRQ
ncbi:hypothetical protein ACU4GD_32190 [Cupriavidus basilensis]